MYFTTCTRTVNSRFKYNHFTVHVPAWYFQANKHVLQLYSDSLHVLIVQVFSTILFI